MTVEEVGQLAVLVVALSGHIHAVLRFWCEVLAYLRYRKDDLLHGAVMADDLDLCRVLGVVVERAVNLQFVVLVELRWFEQLGKILVVLGELANHGLEYHISIAGYKLIINNKFINLL